jgi:hypothetical protein
MSSGIGVCCAQTVPTHIAAIPVTTDFVVFIPIPPVVSSMLGPNMADAEVNLYRFTHGAS